MLLAPSSARSFASSESRRAGFNVESTTESTTTTTTKLTLEDQASASGPTWVGLADVHEMQHGMVQNIIIRGSTRGRDAYVFGTSIPKCLKRLPHD
jgi:hypothetical protein